MSNTPPAPLHIAYLVNWYPAPSHSFIRREILALEALGQRVDRHSIRPGLVGAQGGPDADELLRTQAILSGNKLRLLLVALGVLLGRPLRALRALRVAWQLGRRADRGRLVHLAYWLEALILLPRLRGVDHLHAHFGTNSAMVALLCRELGGPPFSLTVHGPDEFERFEGIALRQKVARAAFVAAISDFCRSQLWRIVDVADWSKVVLVRCGVDQAFLQPALRPIPSAPELLWVGRLAAEKGIPVLVEACRLLRQRGIAFRLRLVGGGPLEAWLRQQLAAAGLAEAVQLLGWQTPEQIREHLDASRGLLLSSFAEGLPVVLMEAMARGRPVVATRIAAIPELVESGISGWVVPPARADLLADAIGQLLGASPEQLAAMGAAGRATVEQAHDCAREAGVLLAAMRAVGGRALVK